VGLLRRREPLHRQLAEAGDMLAGLELPRQPPPRQAAEPPSWDGQARGEAGIHGVPRARRWDAVATVEAPELKGDRLHLISLADGTLIVDEDEPDGALAPLADAVDKVLTPPYRAEAVRRDGDTWAIAASRVELVHVPGLVGDEVELAATREGRTLKVDGQTTLGRAAELERVGEAQGSEYVVRARRVDGDLWEVEASPL
jgi:hypothetical protein